jgi:hypothetical protein
MKYDIVQEFYSNLKNRMVDSDLSHMYKLLFKLMNDEDLKSWLKASINVGIKQLKIRFLTESTNKKRERAGHLFFWCFAGAPLLN